MQPTADYLLRLLADLYADQCGVKVTVEISERSGLENENQHSYKQACKAEALHTLG